MLNAALVLLLMGHLFLGVAAWRRDGKWWGVAVLFIPLFALYFFSRKGWTKALLIPSASYFLGYLALRLWFSDVHIV